MLEDSLFSLCGGPGGGRLQQVPGEQGTGGLTSVTAKPCSAIIFNGNLFPDALSISAEEPFPASVTVMSLGDCPGLG